MDITLQKITSTGSWNQEAYIWPFNRTSFPTSWILICEDNHAGEVMTSVESALRNGSVFTGIEGTLRACLPDCISAIVAYRVLKQIYGEPAIALIDHDVPVGPGTLLVNWLRQSGYTGTIVGISGIPANNDALVKAGANCGILKTSSDAIRALVQEAVEEVTKIHVLGEDTHIHAGI